VEAARHQHRREDVVKAGPVVGQREIRLEITVTGSDRTLAAIQRMVPAHAREINGLNGGSRPRRSRAALFSR
jgi:cation transport ATPase